jgi:hypothetical protein
MRHISDKIVQAHGVCACGAGSVYQDSFSIKWRDFSKAGIKRKKDRKTGEKFLLMNIHYHQYTCNENNQ